SSTNVYACSNSPVLHRPVEPAQFISVRFTERLDEIGATPSIGTVADCLFTGYYDWMESERSLRKFQDSPA
ncbi:MAG: hypothetical protein ABSF33_18550, partial [Acidimicrobiales bacterium]